MGFFENLGVNRSNFSKKTESSRFVKLSTRRKLAEAEELRELLNNQKNIKSSILANNKGKSQSSERILQPEIQDAIKKFNKSDKNERLNIIEAVDEKLKANLSQIIDTNSNLNANYERMNNKFTNLYSDLENIKKNNSFDLKTVRYFLKVYSQICSQYSELVNSFVESYSSYAKNLQAESSDEFSNQVQTALNTGSQFKKTLESYNNLVISKMKDVLNADDETKESKINELISTIKKMGDESSKFQNESIELMNSFIPSAISAENQYYAILSKYANNGVPQNLNLENKVLENIFFDTMLEYTNYSGTRLY